MTEKKTGEEQVNDTDITMVRDSSGRFVKGASGNRNGRPKGVPNYGTLSSGEALRTIAPKVLDYINRKVDEEEPQMMTMLASKLFTPSVLESLHSLDAREQDRVSELIDAVESERSRNNLFFLYKECPKINSYLIDTIEFFPKFVRSLLSFQGHDNAIHHGVRFYEDEIRYIRQISEEAKNTVYAEINPILIDSHKKKIPCFYATPPQEFIRFCSAFLIGYFTNQDNLWLFLSQSGWPSELIKKCMDSMKFHTCKVIDISSSIVDGCHVKVDSIRLEDVALDGEIDDSIEKYCDDIINGAMHEIDCISDDGIYIDYDDDEIKHHYSLLKICSRNTSESEFESDSDDEVPPVGSPN